jgi:4-diphosphocytidyl-2-C-methyl-D-erythritol kinase
VLRPVRVLAPAKLNLFLRVLAREASGFHSLETLFQAISLADEIRLEPGAPDVELVVEGGVETGPAERNLAVLAARAFHLRLGEPPALRIRLKKSVPAAAGLGGGSSDAAAVLRALNAAWGWPLSAEALLQIGAGLGSDVPFFLSGSALALAWGRGERLLALAPLPPRPVVIAHPGEAVPTGEAFTALAASRAAATPSAPAPDPAVLRPEALASWEGVAALARNDFGALVRRRIARVDAALRILPESGAEVALLAGSGGAVFGVFAEAAARDSAVVRLEAAGLAVWKAETLEALPPPELEGVEGNR